MPMVLDKELVRNNATTSFVNITKLASSRIRTIPISIVQEAEVFIISFPYMVRKRLVLNAACTRSFGLAPFVASNHISGLFILLNPIVALPPHSFT